VTITAGIRGTDLWGKADDARDIVCLIEGNIAVSRAEEKFTMNEPLSFYIAPKNQRGQPVAKVSQKQLEEWAAETEISAGRGAIRKGGKWRVYLAEAGGQDEALKFYDDLRKAGYAAEIRAVKKEAATTYRVRVSNLMSKQEAENLGAALKGRFGITEPRVSQ
jgi:cell division septation protein DedD